MGTEQAAGLILHELDHLLKRHHKRGEQMVGDHASRWDTWNHHTQTGRTARLLQGSSVHHNPRTPRRTIMTTKERDLLERAIATLICALAHDEAVLHGKDITELAALRAQWVPDAEKIVDEADRLGLLGDDLEDDEDDDFDEEELEDEEEDYRA
jgi:hypothetical protein